MQCPRCGSEKLDVIKVYRNSRYDDKNKRFVRSACNDTRNILCSECKSNYVTETKMIFALEYNDKKHRMDRVAIDTIEKRILNQGEMF